MIKNIMSVFLLVNFLISSAAESTTSENQKHVFFDWHGVCTHESNFQGIKYLRQQKGTKTALWFPMRILGALSHKDLLKDVYRFMKMDIKTADSFWDLMDHHMSGFGDEWRCFWQGKNTPNDAAFKLIKNLQNKGMKVHLLSNGLTPKAFEELKKDPRFKTYLNDPELQTFFKYNAINRSEDDATKDEKTGVLYYATRKAQAQAYEKALENVNNDNKDAKDYIPATAANSVMIDNSASKLPSTTNKKYTGTAWFSSILYKSVEQTRNELKKLGLL